MWAALIPFAISACDQAEFAASEPAAAETTPQISALAPEVEYGEYRARPEELASVAPNGIVRSLRLNATAMRLGREVYDENCASCHGDDHKGVPEEHAPDLTDAVWLFAGDDPDTGGHSNAPRNWIHFTV